MAQASGQKTAVIDRLRSAKRLEEALGRDVLLEIGARQTGGDVGERDDLPAEVAAAALVFQEGEEDFGGSLVLQEGVDDAALCVQAGLWCGLSGKMQVDGGSAHGVRPFVAPSTEKPVIAEDHGLLQSVGG